MYSSCMSGLTTATAVMARLFCRLEGGGEMLGSVPVELVELAGRLAQDPLPGYDSYKVVRQGRETRVQFLLEEGVAAVVRDLRSVPEETLRRDAGPLRETLSRLGHLEVRSRPLSKVEWDYLLHCVGEGPWQKYLAYIPE